MLVALAFLPTNEIPAGIQFLSQNLPAAEFEPLLEYFDRTYVTGTYRRIARPGKNIIVRNIPPRYPPSVWNVRDATILDGSRTNSTCESWNNSFKNLIGSNNPTIWTCIEALKKDNMMACIALDKHEQGILHKKRVNKKSANLQERLRNICGEHENGQRGDGSFLRAIGNTIRFS